MSVNRKIVGGGVVAAGMGATVLAAASAPSKAVLEMYADSNFHGLIAKQTKVGYYNFNKNQNDSLSSVKNQTPYGAAFWYDVNQKGHCWDYKPWTNDSSFWWKDHDEASSYGLGHRC